MSRNTPLRLLWNLGALLVASLSAGAQSYHPALYPPATLNPLCGRIQVSACDMNRNASSPLLGSAYIVGFNSGTTVQDPEAPPPNQIFVAAFGPIGNLSWSGTYGSGDARAVAVDSLGAVVVATTAGVLRFADGNPPASFFISGWIPQEIAFDTSNNVYVTGQDVTTRQIYTVRLDKTAGGGLVLAPGWPQRFGSASPPAGLIEGRAIVVKGSAVYVAGTAITPSSQGQDALVLKYSLTGGAPAAQFWYDGSLDGVSDDAVNDLAVDADGNVFATGQTSGATEFSGLDYLTFKLAAGSFGAPAWLMRYSAPGQTHPTVVASDDKAAFIALDPTGSAVFVTGSSTVLQSDIVTVKYSAASGATLAISPFDGGIVNDTPSGLFVSSAGQVFVGGASGARYVLLARSSDLATALYGTPSYVAMATLPGTLAGTTPTVACLAGRNTLAAPALFSGGFYRKTNPPTNGCGDPLAAMGIQWVYP